MSFLPFNNRPSLTIADPASYTCPVGKYARISGTLSTDAYHSVNDPGTGSFLINDPATSISSGTVSFEFWINTGDVITKAVDAISASISNTGSGDHKVVSDTGFSRVLLNGTIVKEVLSRASFTGQMDIGVGESASVSGSSTARILIEEYDIS